MDAMLELGGKCPLARGFSCNDDGAAVVLRAATKVISKHALLLPSFAECFNDNPTNFKNLISGETATKNTGLTSSISGGRGKGDVCDEMTAILTILPSGTASYGTVSSKPMFDQTIFFPPEST